MPRRIALATFSLATLAFLTPAALRAQSFQGLGFLPGATQSSPGDVSADGAVVVGSSQGVGAGQAFRWTAAGGMQGIGLLPPYLLSNATGVSADGAVVAGYGSSGNLEQPFRWTAAGGIVGLAFFGTYDTGAATETSADGAVVVGYVGYRQQPGNEAFRWTAAGGMQGLGGLPDRPNSSASGVSADGTVVVGTASSITTGTAFRWTAAGGMQGLGSLGPGQSSGAIAVSADGAVVVGNSATEAFRWTAAGGMQGLGTSGYTSTLAYDVSGDGRIVVGAGLTASGSEAFIWTAEDGMRPLRDVLVEAGVDVTGWQLFRAQAISADGTTIVGQGRNPGGGQEAWRAVLGGSFTSTVTARPAEVAVGDTVTVTVRATNGLTVPLTNVRPNGPVQATSDDGLEAMLVTGPDPATLPTLAVGATDSLRYTFVVAAARPGGGGARVAGGIGGVITFLVGLLATDPGGQTVEATDTCAAPPCGAVTVLPGLVVNSVDDDADDDTTDGFCDTGGTVEIDGELVAECTLRAAIEEANAQAGDDEIAFDIPGAGPHVIAPLSTLPPLDVAEAGVTIDATTQPGYAGTPLIVLDGTDAGPNASGLRLVGGVDETGAPTGGPSTVKGLAIGHFGWYGIQVVSGVGATIEANHLGLGANGGTPARNGRDGLLLDRSGGATVRGNVIAVNDSSGVHIVALPPTYPGAPTRLVGNRIGTDVTGTQRLGNGGAGVRVSGETWNEESTPPPFIHVIGGPGGADRNLISGNGGPGVLLLSRALVEGNRIGTTADGMAALGNGDAGVDVRAFRTTLRGNLIAASDSAGVRLRIGGNVVEGNRIGTNAAGTAALPNQGGLVIDRGFDEIRDNVISGNGRFGVVFGLADDASIVRFLGNRIGTNADGTAALPNDGPGVWLNRAGGNFLGGIGTGQRNLISGNTGDGILSTNAGGAGSIANRRNLIVGNYIGTDVTGTRRQPNGGAGIHLRFESYFPGTTATDETIGEPTGAPFVAATPSNLISGNMGPGVWIEGDCDATGCVVFDAEVAGNFIGTDATGARALGNLGPGVLLSDAPGVAVRANLISGNVGGLVARGGFDAGLDEGGVIEHTQIYGNAIGTDLARTAPLPNLGDGIRLIFERLPPPGFYTLVSLSDNVVAGNEGHGLALSAPATVLPGRDGALANIDGNWIGLAPAAGTVTGMGNGGDGVSIGAGAAGTNVGTGASNVIAHNAGAGIAVTDGTRHNLAGNHLFSNGGLPIDLGNDGPTANDRLDEDEGPNDLTNTPLFETAYLAAGEVFVTGSMAGRPFREYTLHLAVDATGVAPFGAVQGSIGTVRVTTPVLMDTGDGSGQWIVPFTSRHAAGAAIPLREDPLPLPVFAALRGTATFNASTPLQTSYVYRGATSEYSLSDVRFEPAPETDAAAAGGDRLPVGGAGARGGGFARGALAAFAPGDTLTVCVACATEETVVVAAVEGDVLVLAAPLAFAHAAGEPVVPAARARAAVLVTADTTAAFGAGTAATVRFTGVSGGGQVTVERLRRAPAGADGIAEATVLPHRWTAAFDSTLAFSAASEIRLALGEIPALPLERPEDVVVYWRPAVGAGRFTALATAFDTTAAAFVARGFTALGEFALATDEEVVDPGEPPVPEAFALGAATPNPSTGRTTLALALPEAGAVTVAVYDALGRRVAVLLDGEVEAGTHAVRFDATGLPSGVYLVRAVTAGGAQTRSVTLLR